MSIKVAVPKETAEGERRVAMEASVIAKLGKLGAEILIEAGAGSAAHIPDAAFKGASIVTTTAELYQQADIVLKVQPPSEAEIAQMKDGCVLIGTLNPYKHPERIAALKAKNITTYAMELIPRISRAQAMDVLSSQAAVAGYKAAIMGADLAPRFFPMLTTAAGTIRPSKVIVIGAGVAGLQAIATARRLGAVVEGYDVRSATKEQVQSLGAKFIELGIKAEGAGGYARELTAEEKQQQQDELAKHIATADVLITTAAVPGRPSPKIIPESTVAGMKSGAVIIDLAAEGGGNCTLTQPGQTIVHNGVTIHAPLNVPSQVPVHASEMYAKNLLNFLSPMLKDGQYAPDFNDEVIAGALLTHEGKITNAAIRQLVEGA
ncbi:MAG TPA: Re/Si-specific NAD(P)(+) transhydrogenase subunit alpha [Candidatus Thiothrix moscowensis]|uniref:Re/Si-specific NAD(P)(+) transhydrogenase subunit alpha n=1 Tax=unclassified Thiothrix TaxID=2636184 RepID=UPI0025F20D1B|nr:MULTISPECIES: Re/Si-specific NAD(P)(+) transhydrogenase subunit alpha [unclassified Thiothrix]HRJ54023.1 Re/Si-specific NAD(P)(+) transhydrogenase subunit alpha [Candidatus Thiothrix moscowensis]HRJ94105.1 Re/Si-specific NAD(P)(+) transhydrogenase subunit alpha [Candidatus Thiothrix moscowensis]